jgi:two-component system phosphate regulon sensor histidine kinase PhoR
MALLNTAAARLLQLGAPAVIGRPFVSVTTDQALLELFDALRNHPDQTTAQRELKLHRSGSRLTFQALALRNPDNSILLLLRDVTRMADIVQMKTDFVSNAGHELRTPVAAIKLAFETVQDDPADVVTRTRCLSIMKTQLSRLEEMLTDLMDLSKVESHDFQAQLQPIRPSELFSNLSSALAPLARAKGIDLTFVSPDEDEPLHTDWRLLSLVLKNLIENAIKFTTAGKVTATIATLPPQEGTPTHASTNASINGSTNGSSTSGFTATVSDTGIGIAPEHQSRIFERFYQVDPARTGSSARGTGLGLAIVKHAVHTLGGTVSLESAPNKGTTITCTFP